MVSEDAATIRDLKSRNGTIVNGEKITGEHTLVYGDKISVGPLHLEVVVLDQQGAKVKQVREDSKETVTQPKVARKSDKAVITAAGLPAKSDSDCITDWLEMDDDEADMPDGSISRLETRQFKIDETEIIDLKKTVKEVDDDDEATKKKKKDKKEKKEYGKLPEKKEELGKDSKEAADAALRKMMKRGL